MSGHVKLFPSCWWSLGILAAVVVSPPDVGHAKERQAPRREEAQQSVQEALQCEIFGLHEDRARLLEEAAAKAPEYGPAMWHRGYLRDERNQWATIDELVYAHGSERQLVAYEQKRAT
jgi:hypothetical protein